MCVPYIKTQQGLQILQCTMGAEHIRFFVISETSCEIQPTAAFMAQLSSDIVDPPKGRLVVFDRVETNTGGAYDGSQGVFVAPVNGTYNFNLIVTSPPKKEPHHWLHLFIMKNGAQVAYVFLDDNNQYYLRRSTDICIHLAQGDKVWVQVADVLGSHTITGCCYHSHFSGFLIGAD